jgi:hypothetical protein
MSSIQFKSNEEIPEYYKSTTSSDDGSASISLTEEPLYPSYTIYATKKPPDPYSSEKSEEKSEEKKIKNQLQWNEECQEKCKTSCFNTSEPSCEVCLNDCIANLAKGYKREIKKTGELKSSIEDEQRDPEFMKEINEIVSLLNSIGYPNSSNIKQKLVQIRYNNEHWEFYFDSLISILNDLITRYNSTRTFGLMKNKPRLYRRIDQLFKVLDSKTSDLVMYNEEQIYKDLLSVKGGKTRKLRKKQKKYTIRKVSSNKNNSKTKSKKYTVKKGHRKSKTAKRK